MPMKEVILGLGSNLGSSKDIVEKAIKKISALKNVWNLKKSPIYQTAPVSNMAQNDFINLVCTLQTDCADPFLFLEMLQKIERELGKKPKPKNAPRIIDIDILLYGDLYIDEERLEIPHPRMLERLFVLEPLLELKKELLYPISLNHCKNIHIDGYIKEIKNNNNQVVKKIC